jgi:hypothetical protein
MYLKFSYWELKSLLFSMQFLLCITKIYGISWYPFCTLEVDMISAYQARSQKKKKQLQGERDTITEQIK